MPRSTNELGRADRASWRDRGPGSREAGPEQTFGLFRRASAGVGRSLPFARVARGRQNDDKPRSAEFAPSKPPSGLTERHENRSINGAAKPRPTRNFRAADFISSLSPVWRAGVFFPRLPRETFH